MKKIGIGNDHAAIELKNIIREYMASLGYEVVDYGTNVAESMHYPTVAYKVANDVANHILDGAVLICGTGIGMSLAANKVHGIRAVVCSEPYSAQLSRNHNNANILCFGARVVGSEMAKLITKTWLEAPFEAGRHQERIDMITAIENHTFKVD